MTAVRRDESGQVGGIDGLVFGVLVFVFGTLVVTNAWGVIDAKLATTSAAREAARTYVEAASAGDAGPAAEAAAREAILSHGRT
jgi:membrane protein required for beta-lactamase induction